jgi:hypothetical protein
MQFQSENRLAIGKFAISHNTGQKGNQRIWVRCNMQGSWQASTFLWQRGEKLLCYNRAPSSNEVNAVSFFLSAGNM